MTRGDPSRYEQQLLIERIAELFGFGQLAERLPVDIPPVYLLVITALTLQIGVLDSYNYFIADKNSIANDPSRVIVLIGTVFGVIGTRWMRDKYATAMANLEISERDDKQANDLVGQFEYIVSHRAKLLTITLAILALYINLFFNIGFIAAVEANGLIRVVVVNFLIIPFLQIPLIVEFTLVYFSIHIMLPRYISKADLELFFYDPRNMGGFAPLGELFKKSYYLYTAAILLYFFFVYWPTILTSFSDITPPVAEPGAVEAVFFSTAWFLGVLSIGYSMYRIHTVMVRKKEEAITQVEKEIKDILDKPFDINTDHIENKEKREELQHRLAEIRGTNEYPSSFTMWSQIAISVILPQVFQLTIQVVP